MATGSRVRPAQPCKETLLCNHVLCGRDPAARPCVEGTRPCYVGDWETLLYHHVGDWLCYYACDREIMPCCHAGDWPWDHESGLPCSHASDLSCNHHLREVVQPKSYGWISQADPRDAYQKLRVSATCQSPFYK